MSEETILRDLRTTIAAMGEFLDESVVVNNWGFMDQSADLEPFVRIETAGLVRFAYVSQCPTYVWQVPAVIVKPFTEWDETAGGLAELRDAILATVASLGYQATMGAGIDIVDVRDQDPAAPVGVVIDPYIDQGEVDVTPTYLALPLYITIEERP